MTLASEPVWGEMEVGSQTYDIVVGGSTDSSGKDGVDTEFKYTTDRYNKAGKCDVTTLSTDPIPENTDMVVRINGNTLFTGTVRSVSSGIGARQRVTGFDAIADLKNTHLEASYMSAPVETIVRDVANQAGIEFESDLMSINCGPVFDKTRGDKVIEKNVAWGNGVWWVDENNVLIVTSSPSDYTDTWKLDYIRDTSPGKSTPPYQQVMVIGGNPASRKGESYSHMVSSMPIIGRQGKGKPVFTFSDETIESQTMASNVAQQIYRKLQMQQKGGWVEIVGWEEIRPFDSVEMPEYMGGEEYMVSTVKHTIKADKGFVTRLELGGLIDI